MAQAPTRAPLATPNDRRESHARRLLWSADERRGVSWGDNFEQNTQRPKRLDEEPSTAGQNRTADHQRQTGKRRYGDISLADGTPMILSRDDNGQTEPSAAEGIRDAQIANGRTKGGRQQLLTGRLSEEPNRTLTDEDHWGNRNSKRQKLKHRELSSLPGSRSVPVEAGENWTEANSAIDQNETRGSGSDTALGLRRSARIAARQATSRTGIALQTRPGLRPRLHIILAESPTSLSIGNRSSRGMVVSKDRVMSKGNRRLQRRGG